MTTDERKKSNLGRLLVWGLVVALAAVTAWQVGLFRKTPHIALVTAGADPFWEITISGAQAAAEKYDVRLTVHKPTDANEQTVMMNECPSRASAGASRRRRGGTRSSGG